MSVVREDLETEEAQKELDEMFALLKDNFPNLTVRHHFSFSSMRELPNEFVLFSKKPVKLKKHFWQTNSPLAYPCVCSIYIKDDEILVDYDWTSGTSELAVKIAKLFQTKQPKTNIKIRRMSHLGLSLGQNGKLDYRNFER